MSINSSSSHEIGVQHVKIEHDHLKEIETFRNIKNEIETLIYELKNKSKSINWKYLEETSDKNGGYLYLMISEIETYHKIFALDFITEKFNQYYILLIKNIENIVEEHKSARQAAKTLCEINSLELTMENYDSVSQNNEDEDEGFHLIRTNGRATPVPKKRYNLRPRKK